MASYIRILINSLMENQDKLALGGSIIGANVGVFACSKDYSEFSLGNYIGGVIMGGIAGAGVGLLAPVVIPGTILGAPGYAAAKLHSFHKESQKKAGTQVVPQDLASRMKAELRE